MYHKPPSQNLENGTSPGGSCTQATNVFVPRLSLRFLAPRICNMFYPSSLLLAHTHDSQTGEGTAEGRRLADSSLRAGSGQDLQIERERSSARVCVSMLLGGCSALQSCAALEVGFDLGSVGIEGALDLLVVYLDGWQGHVGGVGLTGCRGVGRDGSRRH